ncbi:protein-disulfide reductase DsbD N-terminal domain-containing protein [Burkholderia cepacia]|uniref:protein-disulfide reductase DsbD N-terminal domain-containing protein n=1 Tax=Burkholderia cepacia TaxID=292 RepID=UPI0009BE53AE|nr:protein-disulfide reductase DsbD N-terminal domain-containing protein [Burkholderia cepacia]
MEDRKLARRALLTWLAASCVLAVLPNARAESELLSPEEAFRVSARLVNAKTVELDYIIAPGYHLYRGRLAFVTDNAAVRVISVSVPPPESAFDAALGERTEFYAGRVTVRVILSGPNVPVRLTARGQGCAVGRVCYPPFSRTFYVPSMKGAKG